MGNSDVAAARQAFEALLEAAADSLSQKHYEEAAHKVQAAANAAFLRHPGIFYSRKAEAMLVELSKACLPAIVRRRATASGLKPHILHVLTQAHLPGGHTKLVQRWIENDVECRHSVALTQQLSQPVPEALTDAVAAADGQVWLLDLNQTLIEKARALHEIAHDFDRVVLHIHPFDVVPSIAWGGSAEHPPIIYLNHADHLFWIGTSILDIVANIRASGFRTSETRRRLEHAANFLLPVPLAASRKPRPTRSSAKARLNLPEGCPVALTVASSYKFSPVGEMDYVKLHFPLLQRCPNLQIIVVGPSPKKDYWKHGFKVSEGRIRAVGEQADLTDYLAAADVYLDSTPFGSLTSMLEAGLAGLPCCSWQPTQASILACDDPSFDGLSHGVIYQAREKYWQQVATYLTDPLLATAASEELRASIIRHHANAEWRRTVHEAYSLALKRAHARPHIRPIAPDDVESETDGILLAIQGGFIENLPAPEDYFSARRKRGLLTRIQRSLRKRIRS